MTYWYDTLGAEWGIKIEEIQLFSNSIVQCCWITTFQGKYRQKSYVMKGTRDYLHVAWHNVQIVCVSCGCLYNCIKLIYVFHRISHFDVYAYACKHCKDVLHECIAMQYFIRWSIPKDWPRKCLKKHVINLPRPLRLYFSVVWCVIMSARIRPGGILATRTKNEIHCTPSSSSKQHV